MGDTLLDGLANNDEKFSEDSSNADAAVCEHEQASSDDEEIELY
jgi:hypothetical protein